VCLIGEWFYLPNKLQLKGLCVYARARVREREREMTSKVKWEMKFFYK
jgi:hypothetical protein